jgi:alanine racemase
MRVWAEIDLAKIRHNYAYIQNLIGSSVKILSVVKSDAYGHGALAVSRELSLLGTAWLGVGDSTEALELRHQGIQTPILILGAIINEELTEVVDHQISICIHSPDRLEMLQKRAKEKNIVVGVHLNIDTGMTRLGVSLETGLRLLKQIQHLSHIRLEGICTHFSNGTALDQNYTFYQLAQFKQFLQTATPFLPATLEIHAAASSTLFTLPATRYSMVRPGISLYGMDPGNLYEHPLAPALSLKTQVIYLKDVPVGTSVGYNLTYSTYKPTRIATLPIGYNDGYSTALSNRGRVLLCGQYAPVIGRVTMDYTMIDVTHIPEVQIGTEVVLIGTQGLHHIKAEDLATWSNSIPYEVTCSLGKRVKRVYLHSLNTTLPRFAFSSPSASLLSSLQHSLE